MMRELNARMAKMKKQEDEPRAIISEIDRPIINALEKVIKNGRTGKNGSRNAKAAARVL